MPPAAAGKSSMSSKSPAYGAMCPDQTREHEGCPQTTGHCTHPSDHSDRGEGCVSPQETPQAHCAAQYQSRPPQPTSRVHVDPSPLHGLTTGRNHVHHDRRKYPDDQCHHQRDRGESPRPQRSRSPGGHVPPRRSDHRLAQGHRHQRDGFCNEEGHRLTHGRYRSTAYPDSQKGGCDASE